MKLFTKDVGKIVNAPFKNKTIELHDWSFQRELVKSKSCILKSAHFHDEYQLGYSTRGTLKNNFRNKDHFIPPNTLYMIPPGMVHAESLVNEQPLNFNFLFLPNETVENVMDELPGALGKKWAFYELFFTNKYQNRDLVNLYSCLVKSLYNGSTELEQETHLIKLVCAIQANAVKNSGNTHAELTASRAVLSVKDYITANFDKKLSLDEIAVVACMSKYHLLRTFHNETGMPIHRFQLQLKIAQAKKWLKAGKPIADVWYQLGFNDQAHFTNTFKKHTAQLPKNFKQQYFTIFSR